MAGPAPAPRHAASACRGGAGSRGTVGRSVLHRAGVRRPAGEIRAAMQAPAALLLQRPTSLPIACTSPAAGAPAGSASGRPPLVLQAPPCAAAGHAAPPRHPGPFALVHRPAPAGPSVLSMFQEKRHQSSAASPIRLRAFARHWNRTQRARASAQLRSISRAVRLPVT